MTSRSEDGPPLENVVMGTVALMIAVPVLAAMVSGLPSSSWQASSQPEPSTPDISIMRGRSDITISNRRDGPWTDCAVSLADGFVHRRRFSLGPSGQQILPYRDFTAESGMSMTATGSPSYYQGSIDVSCRDASGDVRELRQE